MQRTCSKSHAEVRIRPARADAEEAQALSALAFRSKSHWGYSAEFMEACRAELSYSSADLTDTRLTFSIAELVTARPSAARVGFYAIEKLSEDRFELDALFVAPEWIGTGVGRQLMDHARQRASELGGRTLMIQSDPNAQPFYESAGAVVVATRESQSISGRMLPELSLNLRSAESPEA